MKKLITLSICALLTLILLAPASLAYNPPNKFTLPPLPYAYDALEPYIDTETMKLHHDKHHRAYVDNLNKALEKYPELYSKSLEELIVEASTLPEDIKTAVINNAGGDYNHTLFWNIMTKDSTKVPIGKLGEAIIRDFGSFDKFKGEFKTAALSRFGSGWAWLVSDCDGKLSIISTANQDTPLPLNLKPVILLDVWEHAYYLKYQNRRSDYIDAWWNIVNWNEAEKNYNS